MKNDGKFSNWHSVRRLIAQGNIFSLVILNLNEKLLIFLHLTYSGTQAEDDVLQHVESWRTLTVSVSRTAALSGRKKWPSAGANQQAAARSP